MTREVVITGLGVVTPLGNDAETLHKNLIAGLSGVKAIERFDTEKFSVKFAGEIRNFDATPYFEPKEIARTSRNIQYLMHSCVKAVEMAGLKDNVDKTRAGVIIGTGMGGIEVFTDNAIALGTKGPGRVSPFFIPQAITNMASGTVAIHLGWMGPNWSVTSACATGNHSIISAADTIMLGRADVMLAGGGEESVCAASLAGFANMKALSRRNDAPEKASRPFDKDRDGFVMGEGAGAVVLESREHAEARGAKILGVLRGYGASCDAYHMSQPLESGDGVALAMRNALQDAGLSASDIGIINCHATSTPLGDVAEFKAVKKVFGSAIGGVKMHGTKSMLGHPLGAASAIEAVVMVMALNKGQLHPTINLDNQEPEIDVDCIANKFQTTTTKYGLSNSFGFGGHNSCVVFEKA